MFFPVITRLRTYGVPIAGEGTPYVDAVESLPAVTRLVEVARQEPKIPIYDEYLEKLGGDPDAALPR